MKNPYSASYYRDYYVNPLFTKLGIANLYYLWLSYFCIIRPAMLTHKLKVLDFGCGIGNQVWALRKLGIEAFGIDPSESAKKYSRAPHFCRYERFKKLPYPDNYFDLVYSNEVLEHIPEKELDSVMKELRRVSKGIMIHMVGVSNKGRIVIDEPTHEIIEDETWWESRFKKLGFRVTKGNLFYFFPNIHMIFTGHLAITGIKSGYFYLQHE